MAPYYTPTSAKRHQNISEAKLNRLLDLNQRLQEQLEVKRITVSEASTGLIDFCKTTRDPMVPSVWGPVDKENDPFSPSKSGTGCCSLM